MKLSIKMMLLTVGIAFFALLSASLSGYYFGVTETRNHIDNYLASESRGTISVIDGWIRERASVILVLESVLAGMDNPEKAQPILLRYVKQDPNISDIYMGFEDGRFISAIGWQPPQDYDPRVRPWYLQALKAGKLNYSDPYLDMTTGKYAISVGIPIKDKQGRVLGILGEDILLDTITNRVQSIDLDGMGYGFLLDRNGIGLSHPDPYYINVDLRKHPDTASIVEIMLENGNGLKDYLFKGKDKIMVYRTAPSTGWLLGLAVEKSLIYAPLERLRTLFLLTALGIMILVVIVSQIFSIQLTRRLSRLTSESRKIEKGASIIEITPQGKDEITELTWAFIHMTENLSKRILERNDAIDKLDGINQSLEQKVEERTAEVTAANQELLALNDELIGTLEKLRNAQRLIIESERMAALGGMVSGIAHEINTPIGVAVTCTSYLDMEMKALESRFVENDLNRRDLESFIDESKDIVLSISKNLDKAIHLIHSFKMVSVDQGHDAKQFFDMKEYLDALVMSLGPVLNNTPHRFTYRCPESLKLESYPVAFAQIFTNLLTNSIHHGFLSSESGEIQLTLEVQGQTLQIHFSDNGSGMPMAVSERIFEPFYTTRRGEGRKGLGLHLVYNIVTEQLGGTIKCISELGKGTQFEIRVPLEG
jgi:signal transduction histidine kinase